MVRHRFGSEPPGAYRLPEGSEKVVCYVINTAEYCAEITPQLQDIIRNKIDKAYVDSIDLSAAQDNFQDVVATAIRALVLGLCLQAAPRGPRSARSAPTRASPDPEAALPPGPGTCTSS